MCADKVNIDEEYGKIGRRILKLIENERYYENVGIAYDEVYDIILHMNKEEREKIPKKFIEIIKNKCNLKNNINIDYSRNINSQITHYTKVILSTIYRDFIK